MTANYSHKLNYSHDFEHCYVVRGAINAPRHCQGGATGRAPPVGRPGSSVRRRDEARRHRVAQAQASMRLIDRFADELQLVDRVARPAHATVREVLIGQRPLSIAEKLQRPGSVGREIGHATPSSRLTACRRGFMWFRVATDAPARVQRRPS